MIQKVEQRLEGIYMLLNSLTLNHIFKDITSEIKHDMRA